MKVLLSWSGQRSHSIAKLLRDWLPTIIPFVEPWMSSKDIRKGKRWSRDLAEQLDNAQFGIFCVVPENVSEPWLNFEAGAISKSLEHGRVAPLLVGFSPDKVIGPLSQFQCTELKKDDFYELVRDINNAGSNPVEPSQLFERFEVTWRNLDTEISTLLSSSPDAAQEMSTTKGAGSEDESGEPITDLPGAQEEILKYLAKFDGSEQSPNAIASAIEENVTRTKHHIAQLYNQDYIYNILMMGEGALYGIDDKGREYLIDRDFI